MIIILYINSILNLLLLNISDINSTIKLFFIASKKLDFYASSFIVYGLPAEDRILFCKAGI